MGDLVKQTWDTHPDYAVLCKARDKMKDIAQFVNDQKKKVDNYLKVSEIIESISGMDSKVSIELPDLNQSSLNYYLQRDDSFGKAN